MSLYGASVPHFTKMLQSLSGWLDKATAYAKDRSFDPEVFTTCRLAPDQYPLVRQVQSACDTAKFAVARIGRKEAPKHPDDEKTMDELKARIASALAFIESAQSDDFDGAELRTVELPFAPGKLAMCSDYLYEMALPNFYFHLTHAYAILRHNGVPLGKRDFITSLTLHDAPPTPDDA